MLYAGIDIGLKVAGWAVVDEDANLCSFGIWVLDPKMSIVMRLGVLHRRASELCADHSPSYVGIEMPWVGANRQTALKLAKAWGTVCGMIIMEDHIYDVMEIYPTTAKKALTGNAKATKQEMREAVRIQFGVDDQTASADISDAIGVALATRAAVLAMRLLKGTK